METIIRYIQQTYRPLSVILYGSYANETNNLNSDFDALVITSDHEQCHDTSYVDGVPLDVFVYPASYFAEDYRCEDFVQIFDGRILTDTDEIGKRLQDRVRSYLESRPPKTEAELQCEVDWCVKMLERTRRADAEGWYRWHWVLIDSLEIFCDIVHHPYLGPKKSIIWMKEHHPCAFECYQKALAHFSIDTLEAWITYIEHLRSSL